ncbi:LolA family protein [Syntrophus gentianae]|nr:outer membrane lipoprotein carrier protein LolA [Syntrophus gentianae]
MNRDLSRKNKGPFNRWAYAFALLLISVFLLGWAGSLWAGDAPSLSAVIIRMQEAYERTRDLKATFVQEVSLRSVGKTEREEGILFLKNPRRMLWDYQKPQVKKLIVNPQKAWLYVPGDSVVYVQNADAIFKSKMAVRFLSGMGKLREDFQVSFAEPGAVDQEGNYRLRLIPKAPGLGTDQLNLVVDRKSYQILEGSFTDPYGNATRIRFRNLRVNSGLSDRMFNFKAPAGVEVYNMP